MLAFIKGPADTAAMLRVLILALVAVPAVALAQASVPARAPTAPVASATPAPAASPSPVASPAAASAVTAPSLAGSWDMVIDGAAIFRFALTRAPGGAWSGTWSRPAVFNSNGDAFGNISGGVRTTPSMTGGAILDMVELSFDDPRPGAVPDIFRFRQLTADTAEMIYVGTELRPFRLVRPAAGAALGNCEAGRIYRRPAPDARPAAAATTVSPPEAPVSLRPQVHFLDLTPRPAPAEPAAAPSAPAAAAAPPASAPAAQAAGSAAPRVGPLAPASAPASAPRPAAPASAPARTAATPAPPAEPADPPRIDAQFLDGL